MEKFKKPEFKIEDVNVEENHARFSVEPLERGFGITLGNAIRRVLLSSLPGTAMYAVEIEGVRHEFSAISGIEALIAMNNVNDVTIGVGLRVKAELVRYAVLNVLERGV